MHPGGDTVSAPGACILDAEGPRLTEKEKALFREARPFGFILFARNIDTPDQIRALCDEMREAAGHAAPILIDQEGGRVQRLKGPIWRDWLPALEQVQTSGAQGAEAMYARYRIIAHELYALGIDTNCAPLVDVAGPQTHPFLKDRCYGTAPDTVADMGRAVANGLMDGGVLPVVKHIPGHGRAVVDSHLELPTVEAGLEDLDATDFAPFRALNDLPMGMTAHLVYAACDDQPATTSPDMMRIIRERIGFDGLIMTDDISMKALSGTLTDITRSSLVAGCDVVLHCNGTLEDRTEVARAAGRLEGRALDRANRALSARKLPKAVDIPALEAKLAVLVHGRGNV